MTFDKSSRCHRIDGNQDAFPTVPAIDRIRLIWQICRQIFRSPFLTQN